MEPTKKKSNVGIIASIIVLLGVVVVALSAGKKTETTPVVPDTTTDTTTTPVETGTGSTSKSSTYKDGTYAATGSYMSPGGADQLAVSLTLKNDIVTDATVTSKAGDPTSEKYQAMFIGGYKQYVVGKNIADVKVGKVSGSSLTATGFNDAVVKIKAQAKA